MSTVFTVMDVEDLRAFEQDTVGVVPGFQVKWKQGNVWQSLIGWLLKPFNKEYMTRYTSTFYPSVYFPTRAYYESDPDRSFTLLAHERVHLVDTRDHGFWFRFSYLFPQVLSVPLVLMGSLSIWFLLLALIALIPWPSPWRVQWEKRGYAMSLAVKYWRTGEINPEDQTFIREQFLGWGYYRMSWSRKDIDAWLKDTVKSIWDGTLEKDAVYADIRRFMKDPRRSVV